jgi:hypothetical protein
MSDTLDDLLASMRESGLTASAPPVGALGMSHPCRGSGGVVGWRKLWG